MLAFMLKIKTSIFKLELSRKPWYFMVTYTMPFHLWLFSYYTSIKYITIFKSEQDFFRWVCFGLFYFLIYFLLPCQLMADCLKGGSLKTCLVIRNFWILIYLYILFFIIIWVVLITVGQLDSEHTLPLLLVLFFPLYPQCN